MGNYDQSPSSDGGRYHEERFDSFPTEWQPHAPTTSGNLMASWAGDVSPESIRSFRAIGNTRMRRDAGLDEAESVSLMSSDMQDMSPFTPSRPSTLGSSTDSSRIYRTSEPAPPAVPPIPHAYRQLGTEFDHDDPESNSTKTLSPIEATGTSFDRNTAQHDMPLIETTTEPDNNLPLQGTPPTPPTGKFREVGLEVESPSRYMPSIAQRPLSRGLDNMLTTPSTVLSRKGSEKGLKRFFPEMKFIMHPQIVFKPSDQSDEGVHNRTLFALFVVCLAYGLAAAGVAQALVPGMDINKALSGAVPGGSIWLSSSFILITGIFCLPARIAAKRYGGKGTFVAGAIWLAIWSILAGCSEYVAENDNIGGLGYMCYCRAMQGIGTACIIPAGYQSLQNIWPQEERRDLMWFTLTLATLWGFVLGSVMSSLLVGMPKAWPWAYFTFGTVCLALAGLAALALPPRTSDSSPQVPSTKTEAVGFAALMLGILLFSVSWNQLSVVPFSTPYPYALMVVGGVLIACALYFLRSVEYPLIFVKDLNLSSLLLFGYLAVSWAAFLIWIWSVIMIAVTIEDLSSLLSSAAAVLLAAIGTGVSLAKLSLKISSKHASWILQACSVSLFVGVLLASTAKGKTTAASYIFSIIFVSIGLILGTQLAMDSLFARNHGMEHSLLIAISFAVVLTSATIGLGIAGVVAAGVQRSGGGDLQALRGAQYFGLGLSVLGVPLASFFVFKARRRQSDII